MILLTGATGFIGRKLRRRIIEEFGQVVCVKNKHVIEDDMAEKCTWYGNDRSSLQKAFCDNEINIVIHCATAYDNKGYTNFAVYESNLHFPLMLLEIACEHGCQMFLNTDSFFTKVFDEQRGFEPVYRDAYTRSKYLFKVIARANINDEDLAFINMKLEHVYGEEDSLSKFINWFWSALKRGESPIKLTAGTQKRDWIHVDDVVNAYLTVVKNRDVFEGKKYYSIEIGTGTMTSIKDVCCKMQRLSGSDARLLFGERVMPKGEMKESKADISFLSSMGWKPDITLEEGLGRFLYV